MDPAGGMCCYIYQLCKCSFQISQDTGRDCKKQEDLHSDMSAETATYDSGIGGSVSDTGKNTY